MNPDLNQTPASSSSLADSLLLQLQQAFFHALIQLKVVTVWRDKLDAFGVSWVSSVHQGHVCMTHTLTVCFTRRSLSGINMKDLSPNHAGFV